MFYAVFRHTEINVGAYGFTSITIAYILISAFVNPRDEMYASIIGMPLGILWAVYERKIDSYFEIYYLRKEIVAIAAFVILFIGRLVLSVAGLDNPIASVSSSEHYHECIYCSFGWVVEKCEDTE